METAFLLIGGNMGDRRSFLDAAIREIGLHAGNPVAVSSIYETAAWGPEEQPAFLNQAVRLETELPPRQLLDVLLTSEERLGRIRQVRYGPRTIDMDILFYGSSVISEEGLHIPHPQIPFRRFVLEPLAELAPGWIHPGLNQTVAELLEQCTDPLEVNKIS
jgi:2-amino-4-hydroxy-6-hydroxymethyldihydropteridine diphosphokinase